MPNPAKQDTLFSTDHLPLAPSSLATLEQANAHIDRLNVIIRSLIATGGKILTLASEAEDARRRAWMVHIPLAYTLGLAVGVACGVAFSR